MENVKSHFTVADEKFILSGQFLYSLSGWKYYGIVMSDLNISFDLIFIIKDCTYKWYIDSQVNLSNYYHIRACSLIKQLFLLLKPCTVTELT
jgi:hypothetical protein